MSNPGQGQQGSGPQLLKAEDILKLQCLSDDQKAKYRPAVANLWSVMQNKAADTPDHQTARAKLTEWSTRLLTQEKAYRQKAAMAGNRPQSQSGQQSQQGQPAAAQQRQPPPNAPQQTNAQGQQQGPQINPHILKHVTEFTYFLPPQGPQPGTPEGDNKVKELRNSYLMALNKQEKAGARMKNLTNMIEQRKSQGQDVPQEGLNQRATAENDYNSSRQYVEEFRKKQALWKQQAEQQQRPQQPQQSQQPQQPQPQQSFPQVKPETQIKVEGDSSAQGVQQFNNMQASGQQPQLSAQSQAPSMASIEAARNQQQAIRNSQPAQQPPSQNPMQFTQPGQTPAQGQQPPRPQINPQQSNVNQPQQQHNSPHPQSASSNNPSGPPVPLSHQAAVSAAQRSYSNQEPQRTVTPQQMPAGNYHNIGNRDQLNNPKMPIPKTLNVATPQPVTMGAARPTMGGPTNGAPGMMGQPVINKLPTFQLEGEGDRILSKRKLDELVRQVTGGGEGPGGESLTPEVEEAMLQLADDFVDTVISSACKLSKLRESPQLDIRDIQLVLERNYNIRIPGYASDEVRTVRKLHPAPGWTQKMNAVQAAKVMGGKTDI